MKEVEKLTVELLKEQNLKSSKTNILGNLHMLGKTGNSSGSNKHEEEPEVEDQRPDTSYLGPPSFYEADVKKYMRKFDRHLK